jgi:hypothetical protein
VADEDDDAEDGHHGYKRTDEGESKRRRRAACSPVNLSSSAEDRQERERGRDLRAAAAGIDVFHDERARLVHRSLTQARLVLSDLLPVGYVSESQSRRERNGSERKRCIEGAAACGGSTQVNGGFPRSSSSFHDKPITDSDGRPDGLQWATKFGYLLFGTVHILRLHLRKAVCICCCHEAKFKQIQTSSSGDVGLTPRIFEPQNQVRGTNLARVAMRLPLDYVFHRTPLFCSLGNVRSRSSLDPVLVLDPELEFEPM